jgi:transcriptional regulator with XRE-family HTH domain
MFDLKAFRKINSITQVDLADYLGVGQGFISQIEKGSRPLPKENISKLLANPYGWDVSMLVETPDQEPQELAAQHIPQLSSVEILLRDLLAEERAKIDSLQDRINELIEENARLRTLLESERKGGTAQSADSSSVVGA